MKTVHTIGFDRHIRDPQLRRTVRIEGVVASVELEIDLSKLADDLGSRAGLNRSKNAALAGGLIRCRILKESIVSTVATGGPVNG
jgi:hypothetical protein